MSSDNKNAISSIDFEAETMDFMEWFNEEKRKQNSNTMNGA